ncbi:hypothetical protein KL937_001558 [Ogataea polymorpha]|nr:hypothetical protein KL937_001558 [Ogataea polymorpha]KAG7939025.1 hypothetical protein KL904_001554 [Ogataea polymorpha]
MRGRKGEMYIGAEGTTYPTYFVSATARQFRAGGGLPRSLEAPRTAAARSRALKFFSEIDRHCTGRRAKASIDASKCP